ncbi:MAG: helix-turn-helix transcriptional regulator [Candidatus Brocadiae bacterium]|nr:helix-turn-helix transcriptional regulator [Candidatus Brocadiia bacterium]
MADSLEPVEWPVSETRDFRFHTVAPARDHVRASTHAVKHVGHCLYESGPSCSRVHETFVPVPRSVLERRYPSDTNSFGQHFRKLRMDAGLQIRELARAACLHEMTIINWEHGRSKPRRRSWERVRHVLGLNGMPVDSVSRHKGSSQDRDLRNVPGGSGRRHQDGAVSGPAQAAGRGDGVLRKGEARRAPTSSEVNPAQPRGRPPCTGKRNIGNAGEHTAGQVAKS